MIGDRDEDSYYLLTLFSLQFSDFIIGLNNLSWFYEYWEPTFTAEMQSFVDAVAQGKPPVVGLMDGYKAVQWALAAKKAVDEETVVKL